VRTYVPVSLRPRVGGPQQGNLIAQMAVPLAMRESDAGDELRRIAAETATRKARARTSLGVLIRGRFARRLMLFAVMRQRVNVTTASIPGPTAPLYLAGARILEVFPVLPLIANDPSAGCAVVRGSAQHRGRRRSGRLPRSRRLRCRSARGAGLARRVDPSHFSSEGGGPMTRRCECRIRRPNSSTPLSRGFLVHAFQLVRRL
jgi:uncharacterized protein DUF1298